MKLVITETDERPGADVDDGFATTESELAVYARAAAEREQAARPEQPKGSYKAYWRSSALQCQNGSRTHGDDR